MKKIYSFVLMATMLLVGTNMWAENELRVGSQYYSDLQAAFDAAGNGATIELRDNLSTDVHATLNADKDIILDLGTNTLTFNCADAKKNIAILIKQGRLKIQNGEITNASNGTNYTVDLIRLNGTTDEIDAKDETKTPYSQVIVAANATLRNNVTKEGAKFNVLTICEATGTNNLANGARIDVHGVLDATTYGIKVNGNIVPPTNTNHSPYVYIHKGATVGTNDTGSGAVAAYSSGYARWRIEGTCEGSTGLYAKGGQIEIADNATIQSNNNSPTATVTGGASGVNTGGSAIVVESNDNYPGAITVTVSGDAEIKGASGYAIEETIAEGDNSQVDLISIQGGSITGGNKGAIIVEDETKDEVTVAGGKIDGTIQVAKNDTTAMTVEQFITGTTTDPEHPNEEADYVVTKTGSVDDNPTYNVEPNLSKVVIMNAYGYSTFSTNKNRKIKALANQNLKAYKAAYSEEGDVQTLTLTLITDSIIPANNGVILIGDPNVTYSLNTVEGDLADLSSNALDPASDWAAKYANKQNYDFYVLHDNLMYLYTGATMKEHKAYLPIDKGSGDAPKRIRMVIAEEEQVEAVENVETADEKAVKFIENGQIFIKRGENIYNAQGQIVK